MGSSRGKERTHWVAAAAKRDAGDRAGSRGLLRKILSGLKARFRSRTQAGESQEPVLGEHVELPKELLEAISDARLAKSTSQR